ncbi:transcriptional regulator [Streptomyces sp. NBC_01136]|uniref:transcriptional regulator n=1 Tax=Streptomyces sp. NBC_01136 TaxID=2903754 RepID=UPI003864EB5D|nr:transcriptional regulator [Streptomyces sp. NBC_01136]
MSASLSPLHETLARLDARIAEKGLDRGDVLDVRELSRRTALAEGEIRALLDGAAPLDAKVDDRIRGRVRALYEAYLVESGKRPADVCRDVAGRLGISDKWARSLLNGDKMPNVPDLTRLAEFFRIGEGTKFFTDPAPVALNTALRRILHEWEGGLQELDDGTEDGPLLRFTLKHGVVTLALRGRQLTPRKQEALALMLEGLLSSEEAER